MQIGEWRYYKNSFWYLRNKLYLVEYKYTPEQMKNALDKLPNSQGLLRLLVYLKTSLEAK